MVREALLVHGVAVDPNFEPIVMMVGRLLWSVGRGSDALVWFQRGHDVDPLHNGENWSLALNLAAEGHARDSQALLAKMETQWPPPGLTDNHARPLNHEFAKQPLPGDPCAIRSCWAPQWSQRAFLTAFAQPSR
jgi:hypothetical protein